MTTYLVFHEVDDVERWWNEHVREEVFGPLGVTTHPFRDPQGSNRVGLIAEIPDMQAFQQFMQTPAGVDAMARDGVRPETMLILEAR